MATEQEVEVVGSGVDRIAAVDNLPELARKFLRDIQTATEMTDDQSEAQILAQILGGETVEDIFGQASSLAHLADHINDDITIHGYRWQRSDFDSFPVYMVLDVTKMGDEDRFLLGCGSKACMAQVYAAAEHGLLPVDVTVHRADKPTAKGFKPFRFLAVMVEEKFVTTSDKT